MESNKNLYQKGYNTAAQRYKKEIKKMKEEQFSSFNHYSDYYPFNLLEIIFKNGYALNPDDEYQYDYSIKSISKVLLEVLNEREREVLEITRFFYLKIKKVRLGRPKPNACGHFVRLLILLEG